MLAGVLGGRDHEPRLAAPARAVRVEALPLRRSGARSPADDTGRRGELAAATTRRRADASHPRAWSRTFNPANAVTASRFLTLPPFVWAVDNGYHQWATLFVLICAACSTRSMALVAKIFNCRSHVRRGVRRDHRRHLLRLRLIVLAAYGWVPVVPVVVIVALGRRQQRRCASIYARARRPRRPTTSRTRWSASSPTPRTSIGFGTGRLEVDVLLLAVLPLMVVVAACTTPSACSLDAVPGAERRPTRS